MITSITSIQYLIYTIICTRGLLRVLTPGYNLTKVFMTDEITTWWPKGDVPEDYNEFILLKEIQDAENSEENYRKRKRQLGITLRQKKARKKVNCIKKYRSLNEEK